jgi:hypothetical protein
MASLYRATTFFGLGAATLVTQLLISPLASVLMQRNVWLPVVVGMALFIPTMLIAMTMPETLPRDAKSPDFQEDPAGEVSSQQGQSHAGDDNGSTMKRWWHHVSGLIPEKHVAAVTCIWGDQQVALLMLTLLTTTLGKFAQEILIQFTHKRFGWSWAKVRRLSPQHRLTLRTCRFLTSLLFTICRPDILCHSRLLSPCLCSRYSCRRLITSF